MKKDKGIKEVTSTECKQPVGSAFTAFNNIIDFAYFCGVFNVTGIDGLQKEIKRLKEISKEPHQFLGINGSAYFPRQRRVMFKFDDDEPMHLNSIVEGGEFIIELKEGKIKFEHGGKSFELYIE